MKKTFTFIAGLLLAFTFNLNAADIVIDPSTTLATAYAGATSGDVIILGDGTYVVDANITMTKAITIKALHPKLAIITGATFLFTTSATGNLTVQDVVLDGTKTIVPPATVATYASYVVDFNGPANFAVNNILFENCTITNFGNCFLRANRVEDTCESLKVNNCIIKSNGSVAAYPFFQTVKTKFGTSLELTNSTITNFSNEFIQNYSTTAGGNNDAKYIFKNNTFFKTVTVAARKPFTFSSGQVYVQNNIFVKSTTGTRATDVTINLAVTTAEFTNNVVNDFDAGVLFNSAVATAAVGGWSVSSGNTDVYPNFRDSANLDFTLPVGSALITAGIGDPRWFGTTTTAVKTAITSHFAVYPNPTTDLVYFDKNYSKIEVFNLIGESLKVERNTNVSSLNSFGKGTYLIRATDETGKMFTQKISKL